MVASMRIPIHYYLHANHYDLVTPDGKITKIYSRSSTRLDVEIRIENISPTFAGFQIDSSLIFFNGKSALGQLGLDVHDKHIELNFQKRSAIVIASVITLDPLGEKLLTYLKEGTYLGKLFAADDRRRIQHADYLISMLARSDKQGKPLLSLGGMHGSENLIIEKVDGRVVVYLSLKDGTVEYEPTIESFLPTTGKALEKNLSIREWIQIHQSWKEGAPRKKSNQEFLLVKTLPLHIRTVFGNVVNDLLPQGYYHCSSKILQPDTEASGDIYELSCDSNRELDDIPMEFYSLESLKKHVFFSDKETFQEKLSCYETLENAFQTAPMPANYPCAAYLVSSSQMHSLSSESWISIKPARTHEFPGVVAQSNRQAIMVQRYIEQQPVYPLLKAIEEGAITSQGVLLVRYFPSPVMKRMLLNASIQWCLKGIYFQYPSSSHEIFFSHEDRAFLNDLAKFAIPVYWVDETSKKVLQYIQKPGKDSGMFVPVDKINTYLQSTLFGLYGSNLIQGSCEQEIQEIFEGLIYLKDHFNHPDLNPDSPIALVTGGGPGVMELGNRVAQNLGILSCANIVDFRPKKDSVIVNEQIQNPHIEAKMTYRLDKLVERQAEFNLDFPIFLQGGIGTDFEFNLEEVRRKTGACRPTPVLLFGNPKYWEAKITPRFQCNLASGTIKGSEWVSNCFYCVQTAKEALAVYRSYFEQKLQIGVNGPIYKQGFVNVHEATQSRQIYLPETLISSIRNRKKSEHLHTEDAF